MWFNSFSYLYWSCVCVEWCSFPFSHLSSDSCSALAKLSSQCSLASFLNQPGSKLWELAHCHCLCVNEFFFSLFLFPQPRFIIIPLPKAGFSGWSSMLFISAICAPGRDAFSAFTWQISDAPHCHACGLEKQAWCWQGWKPLRPTVAEFKPF